MKKIWFLTAPIVAFLFFSFVSTIQAAGNCRTIYNPLGNDCTCLGCSPPCPCTTKGWPCNPERSFSGIRSAMRDVSFAFDGWNGSGFTEVTIGWSYPSGATVEPAQRVMLYDGCNLYHDSGLGPVSARSKTFSINPNCLAPGQTVRTRIRNGVQYGTGGGGTDCHYDSAWEARLIIITTPTPTPTSIPKCAAPNRPTLKADCNTNYNNNLTCTWDPVSGATEYQGQIDNESGFSFPYIVNSWGPSTTRERFDQPDNVNYYCQARVTRSDGSCVVPSDWSPTASTIKPCPTPAPTPSCKMALSAVGAPLTNVGDVVEYRAFVSDIFPLGTSVDESCLKISSVGNVIQFISGNDCDNNTSVNKRSVEAMTPGNAQLIATGSIGGGYLCLPKTKDITIDDYAAWWRVINADVWTGFGPSQANIKSSIPPEEFFEGIGFVPGIPVAGSYNGIGSDNVSSKKWLVGNSSYKGSEYDYDYFYNRIPSEITPNSLTGDDLLAAIIGATEDTLGYRWIKKASTLTINVNPNVSNRKVVVFVNGNLNINDDIDLIDGEGFFMIIVSGEINVAPSVTKLEGIYVTDLDFDTSVGFSTQKLEVRGTVVSWQKVDLTTVAGVEGRSMLDNSDPSETFEFAPDQLLRIPPTFGKRQTSSKEVAP